MIELRGIAWNHIRGYGPFLATAQAYTANRQGMRIQWEQRSLQAFADHPIDQLAQRYDLLVIDHPFIGFAAANKILLPLDVHLAADFMADQAAHSVGQSNASYRFAGHQWALAIDAAAHVSAYRPDLLERIDAEVPERWDDVIALAERLREGNHGWMVLPLIPVDALMSFFTLCANAGEEPFAEREKVVSRSVGRHALAMLRKLRSLSHPDSPQLNPPLALERMSGNDDIVYCPLLFGYSNYARPGFRPSLVRFANIPSTDDRPRGAILGGAGLAISASSAHPAAACEYVAFVASGEVQRTLYFEAGGQPGHRAAWTDGKTNAASNDFFQDTLATLDSAYLRPRFDGFMEVQDRASRLITAFLVGDDGPDTFLDALDALYRASTVAHPGDAST